MWNWPNVLTGIGTIIMSIAIIVTAVIAGTTLIGSKKERQAKNSEVLLKKWFDYKFSESMLKLYDNYDKYFLNSTPIDEASLEEIKSSMDMTDSIEKIKNFLKMVKYSLDYKKVTIENINFDFSEIFYISDKESFPQLYNMLKSYNFKFGHRSRFEKINIIDELFLKIAKIKKYEDLITDIESEKNNEND